MHFTGPAPTRPSSLALLIVLVLSSEPQGCTSYVAGAHDDDIAAISDDFASNTPGGAATDVMDDVTPDADDSSATDGADTPDTDGADTPDTDRAGAADIDVVDMDAAATDGANAPDTSGPLPPCILDVKPGLEVIPQTTVYLTGAGACGGVAKKYAWTGKQPSGSAQSFVPGSSFPNPVVTANVAGEYQFCLAAWDASDAPCCEPTCVTVLVIPETAVHVELLWDTPGDPDQSDTGQGAGADLDLHFAHSNASGPDVDCDGVGDPWFDNPYDVFWFNPSPDWPGGGTPGKSGPVLVLDDSDGAGPETLQWDDPAGTAQAPVSYTVGVHYWNDKQLGMSKATVQVYIFGMLVTQIAGAKLNLLDMWTVGRVHWPNAAVDPTLPNVAPFEICYQDLAPCKGGKHWLAKGDWCVTPCYSGPGSFGTWQNMGKKPAGCP